MYGFKKGAKPKPQKFAGGGEVKGPGTGTSDDIKTKVPSGSYIMPADSTQEIGTEGLEGMGAPVPVNLSNGEYQMPPEQVHAVGVQALDQMKQQTHSQTGNPSLGFKPQSKEPELFFADGGVVDEEKKRPYSNIDLTSFAGNGQPVIGSNQPAPAQPVAQPTAMPQPQGFGSKTTKDNGSSFLNSPAQAFPWAADVISTGRQQVSDSFDRGDYARGIGQGVRGGVTVPIAAAVDTVKGIASPVINFGSGLFGGDSPAQPPAPPAAKPAANSANPFGGNDPAAVAEMANKLGAGSIKAVPDSPTPETPANGQNAPIANNITRVGNSFSGSNIGLGYTVNGQASGTATNPEANSAQNQQAVKNLLDRTPTFAEGVANEQARMAQGFNAGGPQINVARDTSQADRERRNLVSAASTAYKGSQNGQLTANQLRTLAGLQQDDDRNQLARDTTTANNDSALTQAQLREQGANSRAALQEAGANRRSDSNLALEGDKFNATNSLERDKFATDKEAKGFQIRAARRTEKLYEQYDAAKTPEEQKAIAQKIQELSGKDQPNRFTVVPGGQEYDPTAMTVLTRPAQVFDNQKVGFIPQPSSQLPPIQSNPAVQKIMSNTKLSREERAAQIRALGYQ